MALKGPSLGSARLQETEHSSQIHGLLLEQHERRKFKEADPVSSFVEFVQHPYENTSHWRQMEEREGGSLGEGRKTFCGATLEDHRLQMALVILIIIDLMCVFGELLLHYTASEDDTGEHNSAEIDHSNSSSASNDPLAHQDHGDDHSHQRLLSGSSGSNGHASLAHDIEHVLHIVSLTILSIFGVQQLGLLLNYGLDFFRHPFFVLDMVVVMVAIVLESALGEPEGGLLVMLLLWRVIRIVHGFAVTIESDQVRNEEYEESLKEALSELAAARLSAEALSATSRVLLFRLACLRNGLKPPTIMLHDVTANAVKAILKVLDQEQLNDLATEIGEEAEAGKVGRNREHSAGAAAPRLVSDQEPSSHENGRGTSADAAGDVKQTGDRSISGESVATTSSNLSRSRTGSVDERLARSLSADELTRLKQVLQENRTRLSSIKHMLMDKLQDIIEASGVDASDSVHLGEHVEVPDYFEARKAFLYEIAGVLQNWLLQEADTHWMRLSKAIKELRGLDPAEVRKAMETSPHADGIADYVNQRLQGGGDAATDAGTSSSEDMDDDDSGSEAYAGIADQSQSRRASATGSTALSSTGTSLRRQGSMARESSIPIGRDRVVTLGPELLMDDTGDGDDYGRGDVAAVARGTQDEEGMNSMDGYDGAIRNSISAGSTRSRHVRVTSGSSYVSRNFQLGGEGGAAGSITAGDSSEPQSVSMSKDVVRSLMRGYQEKLRATTICSDRGPKPPDAKKSA